MRSLTLLKTNSKMQTDIDKNKKQKNELIFGGLSEFTAYQSSIQHTFRHGDQSMVKVLIVSDIRK
jgi:hypothetical protein